MFIDFSPIHATVGGMSFDQAIASIAMMMPRSQPEAARRGLFG
jgi:hypothetical protein